MAFPRAEVVEAKTGNKDVNTPEGAQSDNWVDDSFWLNYAPTQEHLGFDENVAESTQQQGGRSSTTQRRRNKKTHENQHKMVTRNKAR